jgi:hypothetical protein
MGLYTFAIREANNFPACNLQDIQQGVFPELK